MVKSLQKAIDSGIYEYILFDAPLGRAHIESGRYIDLMIYIDTPLDMAMARRIRRDYTTGGDGTAERKLACLEGELEGYLSGNRLPYLLMDINVKPGCDMILDGTLPVDEMVEKILKKINQ